MKNAKSVANIQPCIDIMITTKKVFVKEYDCLIAGKSVRKESEE